jgi:hypothetical protein
LLILQKLFNHRFLLKIGLFLLEITG